MGQKLDAVVELHKEDYLVLSFPERAGVVGFAATSDLNLRAQRSFSLAQKLQATVVALPSESTGRHCLNCMHCMISFHPEEPFNSALSRQFSVASLPTNRN